MFLIQKISQFYYPEQDCIGLTTQNADGRTLLLWLTQRFANRLVGTLAHWLDEDVKTVASGQSVFSLHGWEQSSAEAQLKIGRPADPAAAQGEALLNAADLTCGPSGYTVTFKWGSAGTVRLMFHTTELRQWLSILHRQFDTTGWPKHAWPEWFAAGAGSGAPSTTHPPIGKKWRDIFFDEVKEQFAAGDLKRVHFLGLIPYQYFIPLLQTLHRACLLDLSVCPELESPGGDKLRLRDRSGRHTAAARDDQTIPGGAGEFL